MNPSTAFAAVFADELARCGLREVVVAPGSRSTSLAMAFWALERAGRVRLHVRIDERSASFTALGLAKASGRPVAVLCTSGTAAANFHPAVIEADESAVPLLVLTADRPPELRATGASQTIDQVKLYGSAVRYGAVGNRVIVRGEAVRPVVDNLDGMTVLDLGAGRAGAVVGWQPVRAKLAGAVAPDACGQEVPNVVTRPVTRSRGIPSHQA